MKLTAKSPYRPSLPATTAVTSPCPPSKSSPSSSPKPKKRAPPSHPASPTRALTFVYVPPSVQSQSSSEGCSTASMRLSVPREFALKERLTARPVPLHSTQQPLPPCPHETQHQRCGMPPLPPQDRRGPDRVLQRAGRRVDTGQLCYYLRTTR